MATEFRYDVFISYRRQEPDYAFARELTQWLESDGYLVASDEKNIRVDTSWVAELERIISESRSIILVVSPRYLNSDYTKEETLFSKELSISERQRRIIPIIIEKVRLPYWLAPIQHLDMSSDKQLSAKYERLKEALGIPILASLPPEGANAGR